MDSFSIPICVSGSLQGKNTKEKGRETMSNFFLYQYTEFNHQSYFCYRRPGYSPESSNITASLSTLTTEMLSTTGSGVCLNTKFWYQKAIIHSVYNKCFHNFPVLGADDVMKTWSLWPKPLLKNIIFALRWTNFKHIFTN